MLSPIRIAVVDNNAVFRSVFCRRITEESCGNIEVILQAGNGAELLYQLNGALPDLILMDLDMPVMDGIETARYLRILFPEITLVAFSRQLPAELRPVLYGRGMRSFLRKDEDIYSIVRTIRQISRGSEYWSSEAVSGVLAA
ncbi:MAG: response regulator transcription factor [Bacteroidetes bacterium]|nr:response regulator transcription factor [Bacteroidota bacterium]